MRNMLCYTQFLLLITGPFFTAGCATGNATSGADGFVSLFDGQTLAGWTCCTHDGVPVPPEECSFSARDGLLHCSGQGRDYWIARNETYDDCVLRLEYKITSGANSGVFLRSPGFARPAYTGYEVQIIDDTGSDAHKHTSGSIYDVLTPMRNMSRPVGEWNEIEMSHIGSKVRVVLNGFKVIDADFAQLTEPIGKFDFAYAEMPREGYIGLQNHGGELWFRNIRVKRIPREDLLR